MFIAVRKVASQAVEDRCTGLGVQLSSSSGGRTSEAKDGSHRSGQQQKKQEIYKKYVHRGADNHSPICQMREEFRIDE
jgi:hypothetical protein